MSDHITPAGKSIFDDLGYGPGKAESLKIRAKLMDNLIDYIEKHGLSQEEAAERFGVAQGRVSYLVNGRISKFTIDYLINMHHHAGLNVHVDPEHA